MLIFSLLLWFAVSSLQGQLAAAGGDASPPAPPPPAASSTATTVAPDAGDAPAATPPSDAPKTAANATPAPTPPIPAVIKDTSDNEDEKSGGEHADKNSSAHEGPDITDWLIAAGGFLIFACAGIQIGWMKRTEKAIAGQAKWMETTEGAIRKQAEILGAALVTLGDTAEKELRAYLTVKLEPGNGLDPLYTESVYPHRAFFDFKLTVQNCGKTPAYDVKFSGGNSGLFPQPLPADWPEIKPLDQSAPGGAGTLGANATISLPVEKQFYTQEELTEFTTLDFTSRRIYSYGRVEYRDVFGKPRFTQYCVVLLPAPGTIVLRMLTAEKGSETDLTKA